MRNIEKSTKHIESIVTPTTEYFTEKFKEICDQNDVRETEYFWIFFHALRSLSLTVYCKAMSYIPKEDRQKDAKDFMKQLLENIHKYEN